MKNRAALGKQEKTGMEERFVATIMTSIAIVKKQDILIWTTKMLIHQIGRFLGATFLGFLAASITFILVFIPLETEQLVFSTVGLVKFVAGAASLAMFIFTAYFML